MASSDLPVLPQPAVTACCAPIATQVPSAGDARTLSRQFAALADPARLRLVSLLATADGGVLCACDLVGPVGKSQPTVSHHLKVLMDGLVTSNMRPASISLKYASRSGM